MRSLRWAAVSLLGMTALSACTQKVEPPKPPYVPPPGVTEDVRQRMQRLNPDILFGSVVAARPQDQLVAVADLPLKVADTVVFYAGDRVINVGEIQRIVGNTVHVKFKAPVEGERAPEVGDLAVKFKAASKQ